MNGGLIYSRRIDTEAAKTSALRRIEETRRHAVAALGTSGDWLTAAQRIEGWRHSRDAATNPIDLARRQAISPEAVAEQHPAGATLAAAAVDVVHRIASDPGRLTRTWADRRMAELGAETYTELVGLTAIARTVDCFDQIVGRQPVDLPSVQTDDPPARQRPDDVGEVGAWVHQTVGKKRANVSRALSLVPVTDQTWRALVDSHYSRGAEFMSLRWDRALTRVQVEAVAARTTAELDCFY